jgi:tRNA 2-thiouridine synthesizing protein A
MDEAGVTVKAVIDARGLACPMPLVKLRQALMVVEAGEVVRLLATDPQTPDDVGEFCLAAEHELVEQRREGALFSLVVRKGG